MQKPKVKKNVLTNSAISSEDCYLCDTINLMHEHYNMSSLLRTVSQWDTNRSSQIGSIHHYKCFVCNYDSKHFKKWKTHIMSIEHMSKCHTISNVSSYFCKTCKSLFYGLEMFICKHQKDEHCEKSNLSFVSIFVSELMNCFDSHSKHYYCCTLCQVISEKPIHTSGYHLKKQELYDCKYCNTSLLCNSEELDFHNMSVEHLTFKCIYLIKEATNENSLKAQEPIQVTKTTNDILCTELNSLKLPLIILDRFQKTSKSMAKCNFCNVLVLWSTQTIVKHIHICLKKDQLSSKEHELLVKDYDCKVCNFKTNSFFSYKRHVISPIHLTNSHACGDFYSYFCAICHVYMYGSKPQIKTHLQNNHEIDIIDLPFLCTVLKDNYKYISNHPESDYMDYYDQQYCEEKCVPDQCYACKISFYVCNYEYNLHKISSEHIILKYFIPKNPSSVTTSTTNTNLIINKESFNDNCLSSTKIGSNNLEDMSINKAIGHGNTKKRKLSMNSSISENIKLLKTDNERKSNLAIPSIKPNNSKHQNVFYTDDNAEMPDLNSTTEVHLTEHVQRRYVDLSTNSECSDDLSLNNIMDNKLKNNAVHQESFLKNTNDIEYIDLTKTQVNNVSTETLSNISTVCHKQQHSTDTDHAYGLYVIERLKSIQNPSLKSVIKLKIDAVFCTYLNI